LLTLVACNKDAGGSAPAPAAVAAACGAGYVQHSSYGCLPRGNCQANQGLYQNSCVVLTTGNGSCTVGSTFVNGQCLPQGNCQAGQAFNGQTCIVVGNYATTPQPYSGTNLPQYNQAYGSYNNGYYNNYSAWQIYYQQQLLASQQQQYYQQYQHQGYYQQPYYQQPYQQSCYGCGGSVGLGIYLGVRL
jgi:hypothetical protein